MRRTIASAAMLAAIAVCPSAAQAAFPNDVFGGTVQCQTVPANTPTIGGQRFCGTGGGQASPVTATPSFDGTPIDVSVVLPPAPANGPDGNFPVIGVFHGYGGEKYSQTSVDVQRWLSRGYAVFNPTTRGFWGSCGVKVNPKPSPACDNGYIHLLANQWEVRDFQFLLGKLADDGAINGSQIGAVGQSYGGGSSMQLGALKDRTWNGTDYVEWKSPGGKDMEVKATAPEFGWSNLPASLVPNGSFYDYAALNPYRGPNGDRRIGVMKQQWVERLYAGGQQTGVYKSTDARYDVPGFRAALNSGTGNYDDNAVLQAAMNQLSANHAAYGVDDSQAPAPALLSQGWNDDLFPVSEALRYYNKIREKHPDTPINLWAFDWGHSPRTAINTASNVPSLYATEGLWMDHYVRGLGSEPEDSEGGVNLIPSACTDANGPAAGAIYHAETWADVAKGELETAGDAAQVIAPGTAPSSAFNSISPNATICTTSSTAPTAGAATYELDAQGSDYTVAGAPTVLFDLTTSTDNDQLIARLYDVDPGADTQRLISRGVFRPQAGTSKKTDQVFQLYPQMWKVAAGHELKLELLSADSAAASQTAPPYVKAASGQGAMTVENVELRVPTRDAPAGDIKAPAEKVLPAGYTLARDFKPEATPTPGPTVTATPVPTTAPIVKQTPTITVEVTPKRDRKKPFSFMLLGTIDPPAGVDKATACGGTVEITARKGSKRIGRGTALVTNQCAFLKRIKLGNKPGRRGTVTFTLAYGGNSRLNPAETTATARYSTPAKKKKGKKKKK